MQSLAWHFDFHSHADIRINHDPDVKGLAHTLHEYHIEEIITFAKDHVGFAYYPTRVGTVHPRMKGDAFGDVVTACKAKDLRVIAYISFGVDGEAGRKHPDWIQMREPNVPDYFSDDWFVNVCPFSPYLDELMLPMIGEILADYPVDGFFFDTMGALRTCYCQCCQQQFQAAHGFSIPMKPEDAHWDIFGRFRHDRGWQMLGKVSRFIEGLKPGLTIGFNQVGTPRFPEPVPDGVNCLTLDFPTSGPQSIQASLCAAFGSTADRPSDVMNTIFNQGWGDWSPRPFAGLEQTCAAIWARKSRPYLGDRMHPANRLTPISVNAMKEMAETQKKIADVYPAEDSDLVPDILLLHGPGTMYGADFSNFDRSREGMHPLQGAHHLLMDAGANFSIVAEAFLEKHIFKSKLLILPEMQSISDKTNRLLQAFLHQGGQILTVGNAPICEVAMDWIDVSREVLPWQDHIYLPHLENTSADQPVLVRGNFHQLQQKKGEAVLQSIPPYDCVYGTRFGQGIAPPADADSQWPALIRYPYDSGTSWYLEANLFSDYAAHGNWTQIGWFRSLMDFILPDQTAKVICANGGGIELVAHANSFSTWLFLINHNGEQTVGGKAWTRSFAPMPPRKVTIVVHDREHRLPQKVSCHGVHLKHSDEGGTVTVPFSFNDIWSVVKIDWEQASTR